MELGHRRTVVPTHTGINRQLRPDAPIVGKVGVVNGLPEVLSALPKASALVSGIPSRKSAKSEPLVASEPQLVLLRRR